jgi:hypothetical protein
VLGKNILQSNWIEEFPVHIQKYYTNVPKAYNDVQVNGVVMYVHEDVYLPDTFREDLFTALKKAPDDWGVLGVAGVSNRQIKGYINDRGRLWGRPINKPVEVDTLDEMLLITRGDLKFDEQFPLDFYGADICMQARLQGRKCYVINAYCEHNSSRKFGERTPSFYESEKLFREKYINYLPIATTCTLIR